MVLTYSPRGRACTHKWLMERRLNLYQSHRWYLESEKPGLESYCLVVVTFSCFFVGFCVFCEIGVALVGLLLELNEIM